MIVRSRIIKGFTARGIGQAVTLCIRLVEIPLMFHFWGVNLYGEWLVLIAIPAYLSMSDFGFGNVTARHMAILVASDKRDEAIGVFQSSYILITASSLCLSILLLIGTWATDISEVFSFDLITEQNAIVIMAIFCLKMALRLQIGQCFAGLQCEGKYPLGLLLIALLDLLEFLLLAGAVVFGATPSEAAGCICFGTVLGLLSFHLALQSQVPWIKHGWRKANFSHIKELWKPSLAAMAFPLGQAMSFDGPRLIISAIIGPAAVSIFVAHRQLVRFSSLALAFGAPLQAELAMSYGRDGMSAYRRQALRTTQLLIWLSFLALLFASSAGILLFTHWTSGRISVHYQLLWLLAAATFGEAIWRSLLLPVSAINRHTRAALSYLIVSTIILAPALYIFTGMMGLAGAALALIVAEIAMISITVRENTRLLQVNTAELMAQAAKPPIFILTEARSLWQKKFANEA